MYQESLSSDPGPKLHHRLLSTFFVLLTAASKLWLLSAIVYFLGAVKISSLVPSRSEFFSNSLLHQHCPQSSLSSADTCDVAFCRSMESMSVFKDKFHVMVNLFASAVGFYVVLFAFLLLRDLLLLFRPRFMLGTSVSSPHSDSFWDYLGPTRPLRIINAPIAVLIVIQVILFIASGATFKSPKFCYKTPKDAACECLYSWKGIGQNE